MAKRKDKLMEGLNPSGLSKSFKEAAQQLSDTAKVDEGTIVVPHGYELVCIGTSTVWDDEQNIYREVTQQSSRVIPNQSGSDRNYHYVTNSSASTVEIRPISTRGSEVLDPIPHSLAINEYVPTIHDEIRRFIRQELHQHEDYRDEETFEEANDFDIPDDDLQDMLTQYEVLAMDADVDDSYNPDNNNDSQTPPLVDQDEAGAEAKDMDSPPTDKKEDA